MGELTGTKDPNRPEERSKDFSALTQFVMQTRALAVTVGRGVVEILGKEEWEGVGLEVAGKVSGTLGEEESEDERLAKGETEVEAKTITLLGVGGAEEVLGKLTEVAGDSDTMFDSLIWDSLFVGEPLAVLVSGPLTVTLELKVRLIDWLPDAVALLVTLGEGETVEDSVALFVTFREGEIDEVGELLGAVKVFVTLQENEGEKDDVGVRLLDSVIDGVEEMLGSVKVIVTLNEGETDGVGEMAMLLDSVTDDVEETLPDSEKVLVPDDVRDILLDSDGKSIGSGEMLLDSVALFVTLYEGDTLSEYEGEGGLFGSD